MGIVANSRGSKLSLDTEAYPGYALGASGLLPSTGGSASICPMKSPETMAPQVTLWFPPWYSAI